MLCSGWLRPSGFKCLGVCHITQQDSYIFSYIVISLKVDEYFILWTHDDLFSFSANEFFKFLVDINYEAVNNDGQLFMYMFMFCF